MTASTVCSQDRGGKDPIVAPQLQRGSDAAARSTSGQPGESTCNGMNLLLF
jgi:hypothetical protein